MARTSPVHYIAPSAISITPNANGSFNDLSIYVAKGAKIKIYSPANNINMTDAAFHEWTFTGRNRRLYDGTKPYTIYVRIPKEDTTDGYLIFAAKEASGDGWIDKYPSITLNGLVKVYSDDNGTKETVISSFTDTNWYVRIGDVSLPEDGRRSVTFDTGILGTEQFNTEWNLDPDDMPMRVVLSPTIDGEDAGQTPYLSWGKEIILRASLVEGWEADASEKIDHWEILRNTGNSSLDTSWPSTERKEAFGQSGNISLVHSRGVGDDFNGAVSTIFTVNAWGTKIEVDEKSGEQTVTEEILATSTITIMAETVEKYELELSDTMVCYDPTTDVYTPIDGVKVRIRATDQKGTVFKLNKGQFDNAGLRVYYSLQDSSIHHLLVFANGENEVAEAAIPINFFHSQQNANVYIFTVSEDDEGQEILTEIFRTPIAFVRNGEDSKEREWIYLRSKGSVIFGDDPEGHLLPSLITGGEVEPEGEADGLDTNKQQDGWVPKGWWDEMQGTDEEYHYEYAAYRDYIKQTEAGTVDNGESSVADERSGYWGEFNKPRIWSYFGEDGTNYRCRWTLNGEETFQLVAAYTGAFRGILPLVATLMKRKGNGNEEVVTASECVITLSCEGIDYTKVISGTDPSVTISESVNNEFISHLNNVSLNSLSVKFSVEGEEYSYSIPVIREADEDSIKNTVEEVGSGLFLSKKTDDTAAGKITFNDLIMAMMGMKIGGENSRYGIDDKANAVFNDATLEGILRVLSKVYTDHIESISDEYEEGYRGFSLHKTDNDRYRLEIDELLVRVKAIFNELEIRKLSYVGGNLVISPAGGTIYSTKPLTREDGTIYAYRCYMTADDGTTRTRNWWKVGDQAKCQTFNINGEVVESDSLLGSDGELLSQGDSLIGYTRSGNASNRYYWRLVIGTGEAILEDGKTYNYVDLSDEENVTLEVDGRIYSLEGKDSVFDGYDDDSSKWHDLINDIPQKGDSIVMEGSQIDSERQHVIRITTVGENAPAIEEFVGVGARTQKEDGTVIGPWNLLARRKTCIAPRTGDEFVAKKFSIQTDDGNIHQVPADLGEWTEGMLVGYYARVSYQGSLWLCISRTGNKLLDGTIIEPSLGYPDIWVRQVAKGEKGDKGDDGKQGEQGLQGEKGEDGAHGADGITINLEPSTIIINQKTDGSGAFEIPSASSIIIMQGNTDLSNNIRTAGISVVEASGCLAGMTDTKPYKVYIQGLVGEPKTGYAKYAVMFTDVNGKNATRYVTLNYAVNYLGKFKTTIDADVETKIAEKTSYNYDGEVISIQKAITNVKTSSEGISQQVSSIQGTLDAATGEITNIREDVSEIQQTAEEIKTSVTSLGKQVTETSTIAQTANSISMSVGNANRNLLSDSYLNLVMKKGSYHVGQVYLTAGKKYTLSVNGKVNTNGTNMVVSVVGSDGNSNSVTISEKATTTKSVSFICQASGLYDVTISGTYGTDANSRLICYYVQLEEGETATPYSRSKTDTISHINMLPDMKYLSNGYMLDDELVEVDGVKCKSITKSTAGGGDVVRHNITLDSNTLYTFSFMAKVISSTGDGKITSYLADLGGKKVSVCQGNIIEHTDRVGLASDGYAPLETIKEGEWCRYIIHYMTDDLHDIQGTATLLVRCPDGMQASFCALKFEKGGMASNYGTAEQKLSNTGIDISEGKILLTAETTTIDGNLQLNGIITEKTTFNAYENPDGDGRKLFCVDLKDTKSTVVPWGSLVFLPAYNSVEPDAWWKNSPFATTMPAYREAGTKISISSGWAQMVGNWSILQRDSEGKIDISEQEAEFAKLQNYVTLVCADPRLLDTKTYNIRTLVDYASSFYLKTDFRTDIIHGNLHGRFMINGMLTRFIFLLPGQTLRLKSTIMFIKASGSGYFQNVDINTEGAEPILIWEVENSNDFSPIYSHIYHTWYSTTSETWSGNYMSYFAVNKQNEVTTSGTFFPEMTFGADVLDVTKWNNLGRDTQSGSLYFVMEFDIYRKDEGQQNN